MLSTSMLDVENKLAADQNGAYRMQLILSLEVRRDDFSRAKQGFLPPDEHQIAEAMEATITAALDFINNYPPAANVPAPTPDGTFLAL
jgi:hypothetical protein